MLVVNYLRLAALLAAAGSIWAADPAPAAASVTGRVVVLGDGTAELLGYYTRIDGIKGSLFTDKQSEKFAMFSFRTEPTSVRITPEGKKFKLVPLTDTGILNVYFHPIPNRDYAKPATFTEAQLVATFKSRTGEASLTPGGEFVYTGSIELESAADFVVEGVKYNFRDFGSSFALRAGGPSPAMEEIAQQVSSGSLKVPFTGSATKAAAAEPARD